MLLPPTVHRLIATLCLGTMLATMAQAAAKEDFPGARRKWRHYESPNFELFSSASEGESRHLLRSLELIHATFLEFFRLKVRQPMPVTVYYFSEPAEFRAYSPAVYFKENKFTGFYVHRADRGVILTMARDEWRQAQQTIFHEYVHHLFRVTEESPPAWFNEGTAELFSTLEESGSELHFGKVKDARIAELQQAALLPLEEIFATTHQSAVFREGRHTGLFYSQSWALVHFFHLGVTKLPREGLDKFMRLARSRAMTQEPGRLREACQALLGIDYPELNRQLQTYIRGGKYQWVRLPMPPVPPAADYRRREVPPDEVRLRLAELSARVNRAPEAKLALLQATERDPNDSRAQETLGMLALGEGDTVGARDRWDRALTAGSRNPAMHHELARLETQHLFNAFDPYYRMPVDKAARLRDLLSRSIADAPDQTSAYEMLAWVEGTAPEAELGNVNLIQSKFPTLKKQDRTLLALALVRHRRGDNTEALELLDALPKLDPDAWSIAGAERLRAKIEGRRPVLERAPLRKGPTIVVPPPRLPSGGLDGRSG